MFRLANARRGEKRVGSRMCDTVPLKCRHQDVQTADDTGGEAFWRLQLHRGSARGRGRPRGSQQAKRRPRQGDQRGDPHW